MTATENKYLGGELDLFALADNWKAYVRTEIREYLVGKVLEVGAGIGATTAALFDGSCDRWVCLEPDLALANQLSQRIRNLGLRGDLSVIAGSLGTLARRPYFDCVLYVDVLEHIQDDHGQITACAEFVRAGGYIVILAPAHEWLFSEFDKRIGHLRRYDRRLLRALMPPNWTETKLVYLDSLGVLLSLGNALLLRQSMPSRAQILTWDRIGIPLSRILDRIFLGNLGKSVLAVWKKV